MRELELWHAPELQNNPNISDLTSLQKGDVYSYAIIAHQVYYGKEPFWLGPNNPRPNVDVLLNKIQMGGSDAYGKLIRPYVPVRAWKHQNVLYLAFVTVNEYMFATVFEPRFMHSDWEHSILCNIQPNSNAQFKSSREYVNVCISCWNQVPSRRPDFHRIKKILRSNIALRSNIVDDLIKRYEV